jgi:hypothetical protein
MLQKPLYYEIPVKVEESGEGFTPPSIQDIRYVQYVLYSTKKLNT